MKVGKQYARLSGYARLSAAAVAVLYGASRAAADNLIFDPSPSNPSVGDNSPTGSDSSGNWDTTSPIWYSTTRGMDVTFNTSTPDSAIFGGYNVASTTVGAADNVFLTQNITAQNITLNTSSSGAYYNIFDDGNGENLTLAGNLTKAAGFGQSAIALSGSLVLPAGTHVFAINDTSGDSAPELAIENGITGAGSVTVNNGSYSQYGTLQFDTDNTYTGGTNLIKGRLEILSGGALGTGPTTISSQGNLSFGGSGNAFTGGTTITTPITITRNTYAGTDFGDYPDAITAVNLGGAKTYTISGPLTVDSTDARIAADTNTIVISSNIAQGPDVSAGQLTLDGDFAGFVSLTGNNTALLGGIAIIGGVEVSVTADNNLGGPTAPLNLSGGTIHPTGALATSAFMNDFGTHPTNNGTSATALGTLNGGVDIDAGATFNASSLYGISLGSRGTGTLNFNGTNVFSGTPFFDAGTVNVNGNTSFGSFRLRSPVLNINGGATVTTTNSFTDIGSDSPDSGTVNVLSGGTLNLANQDFNISDNAGTTGVLNLSGTAVVTNLGNTYAGKSTGASGTINMSGGSTFTTNQTLNIGRNAGATGTVIVAGTSVLTANGSSYVGFAGGTGTVTQTGGTIAINQTGGFSLDIGDANDGVNRTTGTFIKTGGATVVAGETHVGNAGMNNSPTDIGLQNSTGVFQMSGGTYVANDWVAVGRFGALGIFNLSGGTFTKQGANNMYVGETSTFNTSVINLSGTGVINDTAGQFWVGQGGGVGVLNVTGSGSLTVNDWLAVGRNGGFGTVNLVSGSVTQQTQNHLTIGSGGVGVFNQTGGALTALNPYIGETNTGTYTLSAGTAVFNGVTTFGVNSPGAGTINLNGGTLTAGSFAAGSSTGAQTFNFNGGALVASNSSSAFMTGLTTANVMAGGASINSSTYAITIAQPLLGSTTSTGGGLTKLGTGSLTLAGADTYTGRTNVTGTLVSANVAALPAGTALTVAANSGVNFNGQYVEGPGSATPGLTLASLTAAGGDTFGFNASNGAIDDIAFNAASAVTGSNTINLAVLGGTTFATGTYNLFTDPAGGLENNGFKLTVNGGSNGVVTSNGQAYTLNLSSTDTADVLTVALAPAVAKLYYTGQAGTDYNTAGDFSTDSAGMNASNVAPSGITDVVFTATANVANTTPTVTGAATANSLEFNSAAGVTVGGTGTITLSAGNNTFAAGTGIVVDAGAGAATLGANLSLPGSESFVTNSANPLTINGAISSTASSITLTYNGSGAGGFVIGGANTYVGTTIVNGPALQLSNGSALGSATNTLNLIAGSVDVHGQQVTQAALNLSGGQLLGSLGTGTLTLSNGAAATAPALLFASNTSYSPTTATITGQLAFTGATNYIAKASGNGNPVDTGNVTLSGNTVIALADTGGDAAGELAFAGSIGGTGSLTLANNAPVPGVTLANTADYATLLLTGSNTYSGGTNINYGRVVIANGNAFGTGTLNISIGANNASGGTVQLGNTTYGASSPLAQAASITAITVPNNINLGGALNGNYSAGIINNVGANTLSGNVTLTQAQVKVSVTGGSLAITNPINQSTGVVAGLTKLGGSTLTVSGANTYTGPTNISGGTLSVPALAIGGTASGIGASPAAPANLIFSGGALAYTGTANVTTDRGYTVTGGTSTINTGTGSVTFGGQILATGGSFAKIGTGPLIYSNVTGTNTYETANTNQNYVVNQGVVDFGTPGATASGQVNAFSGEVDAGATGELGASEIDFNSGTTTISSYLAAARGSTTTGLVSTVNLNNDAVLNILNLSAGYSNGLAGYNGVAVINLNGTSRLNDTGVFRVAESNGSNVTVNIAAGSTLNMSTGGQIQVGYNGIGTVNQFGTVTQATNLQLTNSSATTGVAVYNLSGGTLTVANVVKNGTATSATFNFNGGTLSPTGNSTTFLTGLNAANVLAGGAIINTQAFNISVGQSLVASTTSPGGGLAKLGTGTLTLTNSSNYTGGTTVSAGTLRANAPIATGSGTVLIPTGGTLGGNGSVGAVTVAGTIAAGPDNVNVGTLSTGTETWNGSGGYTVKVSAAGTATDQLVMSGLTIQSTAAAPFTVLPTNTTNLASGTYVIAVDQNASSPSATNPFASALATQALILSANAVPPSGDSLSLVAASDASGDYDLDLVAAATPEPASLILLGVTAAPLVLGRRRRRVRSA